MKESDIQQHVVKLLRAYGRHDICWHHPANGELRTAKTAARLKAMGVVAGVADLILIIDAKTNALELKTEKGKQSIAQAEWQESFERAGGFYFLARGLNEAIVVLHKIGAFRSEVKIHA